MSKAPIDAWLFAVVIVRKGDRFLLVHERKHGQRWYLPAGRVEPGESFGQAAIRETQEEAGVAIALRGVIRVEHSHTFDAFRMRVIFYAEPVDQTLDDTPPKQAPDQDSLGAAWVHLDELDGYPLRGDDVREYVRYVASGGEIAPLGMLSLEGTALQSLIRG
jgi:8-oxo-dGTP pyrophosphatase MutT (NUDIX family)